MQFYSDIDWYCPVNRDAWVNRGLVNWWLPGPAQDRGTRLRDLVGVSHGAFNVMTPATAWVPGNGINHFGALNLTGASGESVICPSVQQLNPFTVAVVASAGSGIAAFGVIVAYNQNANNDFAGWELRVDGTPSLPQAYVDTTANNRPSVTGTTAIVGNGFYHLALTFDGATEKIFVNGVEEGSTSGISGTITYGTPTFRIGSQGDGSPRWTGQIASVQYYNVCKTPTEMRMLFLDYKQGYQCALSRIRRPWTYFDDGGGGGGPATFGRVIGEGCGYMIGA